MIGFEGSESIGIMVLAFTTGSEEGAQHHMQSAARSLDFLHLVIFDDFFFGLDTLIWHFLRYMMHGCTIQSLIKGDLVPGYLPECHGSACIVLSVGV